MVRPIRKTPVDLSARIKDVACQQMAENGASSLSLRAIARELGITAPAIYNYFPDRDALVTALIVDAYVSFGDAQQDSLKTLPINDHHGRLAALGLTYRQWAVTHPERYQLIFGTPIPGYHAPDEVTQPVAARALGVLIGVLAAAFADGRLRVNQPTLISPHTKKMLKTWQSGRGEVDARILFLALIIWSRVHGLVSLEIGSQYPPFVTDTGALYRCELESIVNQFIGD